MIGDGDAMCVTTQIVQQLSGACEGWLRIDISARPEAVILNATETPIVALRIEVFLGNRQLQVLKTGSAKTYWVFGKRAMSIAPFLPSVTSPICF